MAGRNVNRPDPFVENMAKRVVSGMRPTGKLHLGHLVGALQNWDALQASTTASTSSPTGTR